MADWPVTSRHGTFCSNDFVQRELPRLGGQGLEEAQLAVAVDQDPPWLEVLVEAGQREAGLLDVGAGDAPCQSPRRPASSSSGRPIASGRDPSSAPTVTAGTVVMSGPASAAPAVLPLALQPVLAC